MANRISCSIYKGWKLRGGHFGDWLGSDIEIRSFMDILYGVFRGDSNFCLSKFGRDVLRGSSGSILWICVESFIKRMVD